MRHPVEELYEDHRLIEKMLDEWDRIIRHREFLPEPIQKALTFFTGFADAVHHHREEQTLFPALTQAGVPVEGGPISVMLHEHELGRACLRGIRDAFDAAVAGDAEAQARIRRLAADYSGLLRNHIWKEDNVLFPMAEKLLVSEADCRRLSEGFRLPGAGRRAEFAQLVADCSARTL